MRIRHYPVTVSAESFDDLLKATGACPGKASRSSLRRKSGDLPEANRASFGSEGRAEEHSRQTPLARALPVFLSHSAPRALRARASVFAVRAGLSSLQPSTHRQGVGKAVRIRHYPVTVSAESSRQRCHWSQVFREGCHGFGEARSQETGLASPIPRGK